MQPWRVNYLDREEETIVHNASSPSPAWKHRYLSGCNNPISQTQNINEHILEKAYV